MSYELSRKNSKIRRDRMREAKLKGDHTDIEWADMLEFFDYTCVRCLCFEEGVVKDHIIPIYQGGSNGLDNIQPLCRKCNSSKASESIDWRPNGAYYLKKEIFRKYTQQGGEYA